MILLGGTVPALEDKDVAAKLCQVVVWCSPSILGSCNWFWLHLMCHYIFIYYIFCILYLYYLRYYNYVFYIHHDLREHVVFLHFCQVDISFQFSHVVVRWWGSTRSRPARALVTSTSTSPLTTKSVPPRLGCRAELWLAVLTRQGSVFSWQF